MAIDSIAPWQQYGIRQSLMYDCYLTGSGDEARDLLQ